jgi:hypothetical protein
MKLFIYKLLHSEYLSLPEILKLKNTIISLIFLPILLYGLFVSSAQYTETEFYDYIVLIRIFFSVIYAIGIMTNLLNLNRVSMHLNLSLITFLSLYLIESMNSYYVVLIFFILLVVVAFYQDLISLVFYGLSITGYGIYYIISNSYSLIMSQSILEDGIYLITLIFFYLVLVIQGVISDVNYDRINKSIVLTNEVKTNIQKLTFIEIFHNLNNTNTPPVYKINEYRNVVNELSVFIAKLLKQDEEHVLELVDFYFALHGYTLKDIAKNKKLSKKSKQIALKLYKYVLSAESEMLSILLDTAGLYESDSIYEPERYFYQTDKLFHSKTNQLLYIVLMYAYMRNETVQYIDSNSSSPLTHLQIKDIFLSTRFQGILTKAQIDFFVTNEASFRKYL